MQSWQAMTPDQQGRFCAQCQNIVLDFTTMTDAQVLTHIHQSGGPGCGRFRSDQLNRPLVEPSSRQVSRWQWVSLLLSGWLSSQAAQAQSVNDKRVGSTFIPALTRSVITQVQPTDAQPRPLLIEGRVIDNQTRKPLANATIVIRNTPYSATTDSAGAFRLELPEYSPDSTVWAVASLIGYSTIQYKVEVGRPQLFAISEDINLISESISVGGYVVQKPTRRQRIRNWFKH